MIKINLLILLLLISFSEPVRADGEILVIQSARISLYEEALNGFLSVPNPGIKRLVLSESETTDIAGEIKNSHTLLILAIGRDALLSVKEIRDIPVVYIMVLAPDSIVESHKNFYGIYMNIHPEKQLELFTSAIPGINNIGMIYLSDNAAILAGKAIEAAKKYNIKLIVQKASKTNEAPTMIKEMAGKIDAFWMLPDIALITPEAVELLLITSIEKKIPILTFSDKYVEMGALMSVAVKPHDMGKQAGETAQKILNRNINEVEKRIFARKELVTINTKIAKKLGIDLNLKLDTDSVKNK